MEDAQAQGAKEEEEDEEKRQGDADEGIDLTPNSDPQVADGLEPDSHTPLLVKKKSPIVDELDAATVSQEVSDAAKAFSKLKPKPKTSLWISAAKTDQPQQREQPQQEQRQQQESVTSIESPVPFIEVTEPSLDNNANASLDETKKAYSSSSGFKSAVPSSIHFTDVVMSSLQSQISQASSYSAIEICVYMMDNKGLTLVLDEGRLTTSDFILDIVLDELSIPDRYKPCFGIWLSSPLLHLQLRPTHVPHLMAKHWAHFLKKFTLASEDQFTTDEPILRLQRNVFLSPAAELQIEHPEVVRLLYCEARENVLEGLYPIDIANCFRLAGLSSVNQFGLFNEADHKPPFYKELIPSLLPEWIEKSRSALLGCSGSSLIARMFSRLDKVRDALCHDLLKAHKAGTERITKSQDQTDSALYAQRQFLQHCYQLPFYGCAFFRGILYKPSSIFTAVWNLDRGGVDATFPVTIAVSLRGVCLLDLSTAAHLPGSLILSVPFSQLYWMTAELTDTENEPGLLGSTSPAVLPSLFLYFRHPDGDEGENEGGELDNRMLQIVSKQAHLIDALMQTCVQLNQCGFSTPSSKSTEGVMPQQVFGSGVHETSLFAFDWEKEEAFLRSKEEQDQCLAMQLERLRLRRAADFDE